MTQGYELLKLLYETFSPSRNEKRMRKVLRPLCKERGAKVVKDDVGNLLVTKGKADSYPCICAHMDQVQHRHSKDFTVYRQDDCIFAFSAKAREQQGLGADDKNGLWIALELLAELPVLKCAFFVGEEIGCIGSNHVDLGFFDNVRYCVQADRRNGDDLITSISGNLCSEDFLNDIGYQLYGYRPTQGLTTDVGTLVRRGVGVSCINISCGYYDPHTDHETTEWGELQNAKAFAKHICEALTDRYPHEYEPPTYLSFGYDRWRDFGLFSGYRREHALNGNEKSRLELVKEQECRDTMQWLLESEPHLTFEELWRDYQDEFTIKDADRLRPIYKEVHDRLMNEYIF